MNKRNHSTLSSDSQRTNSTSYSRLRSNQPSTDPGSSFREGGESEKASQVTITQADDRKNCGMVLDCPHCTLKIQACRHTPRCIQYVEGFSSWDEFLESGLHK